MKGASPANKQARAVRGLLAHRLGGGSAEGAKAEWYAVVEGDHALWAGVSEPYKHTIRAFLVYFHTQILRHSSERFNFRNGSVGAAASPCWHPAPHGLQRCQAPLQLLRSWDSDPRAPAARQATSSSRARACSSAPWRRPSSCSAAWRASPRALWCCPPSAPRSASRWAPSWPAAPSSVARTRSATPPRQVRRRAALVVVL